MRFTVVALLACAPALALAEDGGDDGGAPAVTTTDKAVIGGAAAPAGKWPDAVGVMWSGDVACTGTLVAPQVVMTAGHCVDGGAPTGVLIGASALSRRSEGETITVTKAVEYPNSWQTVDAGLLVLAKPSMFAPRPIATGWAKHDIKNGATVQFVGFGTIDRDASIGTDALMEAASTITDFNCSTKSGCNTEARPDGELGAGGMGIDTCPGDSGGPMYLTTAYGSFLAGITSRGYNNNVYACSEGGIYGRPDKIVDWIEEQSGFKVARGPEPTADLITAVHGSPGEVMIAHNDPKPDVQHVYEVTTPPMYGTAAVRSDGLARVCAQEGVFGGDQMTVTVADASDPTRAVSVTIPILITDGNPDGDCDPEDFGDTGGCCDTRRGAGGSIPLALFVLLVLRRRR